MITYELQETRRDVSGDGGALPRRASGRVPGPVRVVGGVGDVSAVRDIRSARSVRPGSGSGASGRVAGTAGSSRPQAAPRRVRTAPVRTRAAGRAAALCADPVAHAPRTVVSPARHRMRRLVAGAGVALASAAVVFGLGLLADAASASHGAPTLQATVLDGS